MKKTIFMLLFTIIFSTTAFCASENEIICENIQSDRQLIEQIVFSELDNMSEDFFVILKGSYIESLDYNKTVNESTEFEGKLIEKYMQSGRNDYNSLILRKYTILKTVTKNILSGKVKSVKLDYKILWSEDRLDKASVYNYAKVISKNILTNAKTEYEKITILHDYIVNNFRYDTVNSPENYNHNASEMIRDGYGVCSAYTSLFFALLEVSNIESRIILKDSYSIIQNGEKVSHTWNLVKINQNWYHIDSTWDDPVIQGNINRPNLDYFLLLDDEISKDHIWDVNVYPLANSKFSDENIKKVNTTPVKNKTPNKINIYSASSKFFVQDYITTLQLKSFVEILVVVCIIILFYTALQFKR